MRAKSLLCRLCCCLLKESQERDIKEIKVRRSKIRIQTTFLAFSLRLLFLINIKISTPIHENESSNHHLLLPFISSAQSEMGSIIVNQMSNERITAENSSIDEITSMPARIPRIIPVKTISPFVNPSDRNNKRFGFC